jgi:hypothetical protein
MVGGSLMSSAMTGRERQKRDACKRHRGEIHQPAVHASSDIVSSGETFYDWDDVIAALRWQRPSRFTAAIMPVASADQLSRIKSMSAQS